MEYRIILLEKDGVPISNKPYRIEQLIFTKIFGITIKKDWVEVKTKSRDSFPNFTRVIFDTYEEADKYITYTLKAIDTPITRKVVTK